MALTKGKIKIGNTEYKVKRLFSDIGFTRKIIRDKEDKFIIKVKQTSGY